MLRFNRRFTVLAAGLALIAAAGSHGPRKTPAKSALSKADAKFLSDACQGDTAEVTLGNLMAKKATSLSVKAFGRRMVQDHSKGLQAVKKLAMAHHMMLPTGMKTSDQVEATKLQKMAAKQADAEYKRYMIDDHHKDIADFTKEAKGGSERQVKAMAAESIPMLKMHLQMAQAMKP